MCGIAGIIGEVDERKLRRMTDLLRHRGPDDGDVLITEGAGLGHRRLSILDLSEAGRQPMRTADGNYTLVFNGEIFNYRELRSELEQKGHLFRSRTDSEVLLHACVEWGEAAVERLVGQFAFGFWDHREHTLLLARDHLGIKPLYYAETPHGLYFASEAKSLAAVLPHTREVRWELLPRYLAFLWVPGEDTLFTGVHKMLPGTVAVYRGGMLRTRRYWDPVARWHARAADTRSAPQRDEEFRHLLSEAVRSQLVADVPLGLLLSGGIDSTILLAEMAREGAATKAFTATYSAASRARDVFDDDLPFARVAAQDFGADLQVAELEADVPRLLPEAVWHLDEPLADPTVVSNLALTRRARSAMTVMLSGMGADEILAGYPRYPAVLFGERTRVVPAMMMNLLTGMLQAVVHFGLLPIERGRRPLYLLRHLPKPFFERFMGYSSYNDARDMEPLLDGDAIARMGTADLFGFHAGLFSKTRGLTPLSRMLATDLCTFLPYLNLENMDKTSMANGVEMRVPFLDHRLVEYSMALPDDDKLHARAERKVILRRAWKGVVPEPILRRPKTGYSPPVRGWMRETHREFARDILLSQKARERGVFRPARVEQLFAENTRGREDHSMRLWQLLVFELWMQRFIDADGGSGETGGSTA